MFTSTRGYNAAKNVSPWNSIALVPDPINNPLHWLVSCIVSWSSWTLTRVSFVSAVKLKIPRREGLFRRCLLIPYLRRSLDVNTCSEVETPSDLSGRLIGQRRNENYALRLCALPRCSHEEKSLGPLRRSSLPVSKSIKPTELQNFPDQRYRNTAASPKIRVFSQFVLTGESFCSRFWRSRDLMEPKKLGENRYAVSYVCMEKFYDAENFFIFEFFSFNLWPMFYLMRKVMISYFINKSSLVIFIYVY